MPNLVAPFGPGLQPFRATYVKCPGGVYSPGYSGYEPAFAPPEKSLVRQPGVPIPVRGYVSPGQGTTGGSSLSWKHTVYAGLNRVLFVSVDVGSSNDASTSVTVTYGGVALTSVAQAHAGGGTGGFVQLFQLIAPPIGKATVSVSVSAASISVAAGSVDYSNANQTTPISTTTATGSGTAAATVRANAVGNMGLYVVGAGSALAANPTNPARLLFLQNQSSSSACGCTGMAEYNSDVSNLDAWTITASDSWAIIAGDINASTAADPTFVTDTTWGTFDYETGDTTQFTSDTSSYLPSTPVVATSSPAPAQGTYRGAYSVPAGTSVAGAGVNPRCENIADLRQDFQEGDDFWFGGWIRLDPAFPIPAAGQFTVVTQWKNEGTGSPPIELAINNDTSPAHWRIDGGFGYPTGSQQWVALDSTANTIVLDTWIRWDFHIAFFSDPALGTLNVWQNGTQLLTNYHSNTLAGTLYPGITSYWKVGYYRSEAITAAGTVYHDGWKMGKTANSVNFGAQAASVNDNPGWSWAMNI